MIRVIVDAAAAEWALLHSADPRRFEECAPARRSARFEIPARPQGGSRDDVRRRGRSLRPDALQPLRRERSQPPRDLARALAQLRRRTTARDLPCDRASRLRPRRDALRSREQLRAAVRLGGGDFRSPTRAGPAAVPRRADRLHEGRLRHVARPVRRRRLAQVPAREPRPEPGADGARLRRHLLLPPL